MLRFLGAAVVIALAWAGSRIMVRRSRLEVRSPGVHLPTVSGSNLQREEIEFPRDFEGRLNLLFVAFLQSQQAIIDTWTPFAEGLEAAFPGLVYYELPTIDERPMLSRTFINEGMRAGIPNPKARDRTVTLYVDTAEFMQATGIPSKDNVHILLVDRDGEILWRTTGRLDEAKGDALREVVRAHLGPAEAAAAM